ncbi:MAG: N-acetylglucosamine kinase, partial [Pseudorhodoplanes sp.]|nr:N-acetylglucosamine kinase [Pseudorhodoplanes sp.]
IDALAARLIGLGTQRLSLVGGLAQPMQPWLSRNIQAHLVPPAGDALDGALQLARGDAELIAA